MDMQTIKQSILTKFEKALAMELPLKDIIGMGNVIAQFEKNAIILEPTSTKEPKEKLV